MNHLNYKLASVFLIASTILGPLSAHAHTFKCYEIDSIRNSKYSIVIEEIADITKQVSFGNHYDYVFKVNVMINKTNGRKMTALKYFQAVATSADVIYTVHALKSEGIKIGVYLDEADEAYMEHTDSLGKKVTTQLHCE